MKVYGDAAHTERALIGEYPKVYVDWAEAIVTDGDGTPIAMAQDGNWTVDDTTDYEQIELES